MVEYKFYIFPRAIEYKILTWFFLGGLPFAIYFFLEGKHRAFVMLIGFSILLCILYAFLSAIIMNCMKKPILKFTAEGFYYTSHLLSREKLIEFHEIDSLEIFDRYRVTAPEGEKYFIVYLKSGRLVWINRSLFDSTGVEDVFITKLPQIKIKYNYGFSSFSSKDYKRHTHEKIELMLFFLLILFLLAKTMGLVDMGLLDVLTLFKKEGKHYQT